MEELQDNIKKLTELVERLKFINKEIRYIIKVTEEKSYE